VVDEFGIIYGISAFGLGQQISVPPAEAGAYIRAYFERFPAILAYMERTKTNCRGTGYVETIFGRKCFISGIRDANPMRRAGAERQAINAPLQGSAPTSSSGRWAASRPHSQARS
jgi:DNA polymerase-1